MWQNKQTSTQRSQEKNGVKVGNTHPTKQRYYTRPVGWALPTTPPPQANRGFTLLELVMVIIVIAILGLFALDRVWSLRIAAERAVIQQVTGNLRSALGMEVARYALENRVGELPRLDGSNPMLLLAQTPVGYLGEVSADSTEAKAGSWYFDPATKTLNYHVSYAENFASRLEQPAQLRWQIHLIYRDRNNNQQLDPGVDAIQGLDLIRLKN